MSRFTSLRTKLVDGDAVEAALSEMKVSYERGEAVIKGWGGLEKSAEFRVRTNSRGYDIGLAKQGGRYEIVADWWGVRGTTPSAFASELNRRYATEVSKRTLASQGFEVVDQREEANGQVRLVLRRMA